MSALNAYKTFQPFTEHEAWTLFKLAAIAEAVGWTLLIFGILLQRYVFSGNDMPVSIAGQVHGILFLGYIAAVLAVSPSLGWSLPRTVVAGLFSIPPYGTIVFEQFMSYHRRTASARRFRTLHTLLALRT